MQPLKIIITLILKSKKTTQDRKLPVLKEKLHTEWSRPIKLLTEIYQEVYQEGSHICTTGERQKNIYFLTYTFYIFQIIITNGMY